MADPSDLGALTLAVGEMRGQLREMIHAQNNTAQKLDGIYATVLRGPSADDFSKLAVRVAALETKESERRGATSMGAAVLKSPIVGWLVGAALTVWALLKGGSA